MAPETTDTEDPGVATGVVNPEYAPNGSETSDNTVSFDEGARVGVSLAKSVDVPVVSEKLTLRGLWALIATSAMNCLVLGVMKSDTDDSLEESLSLRAAVSDTATGVKLGMVLSGLV